MELLERLRAFIRMDLPSEELNDILSDFYEEIECTVPVEDWIILYEKMSHSEMTGKEFFDSFLEPYFSLTDDSGIYIFYDLDSEIDYLKTGSFFVDAMQVLLSWDFYNEYENVPLMDALKDYPCVKDAYDCYMFNLGKPFSEQKFPDSVKSECIRRMQKSLGYSDSDEISLYRTFIEELCAKDDIQALECKGYGCYGGDEAFACDWEVARDCMLRLLDVSADERQKAVYANTLGYIYYYGRCNNKIPEYEKAFQMYTTGAAGGVIESMYKLADMYLGGRGVPQNKLAGENIIRWIYEHHYEKFLWGEAGKIADLALRMGRLEAENGNNSKALYYLTQADYAIRQRMPRGEYGDRKVFRAIQEALSEVRNASDYKVGCKSISDTYPLAISKAFENDYIVKITLKPLKNSLKIIADRRPKASRWNCEKIEVAFPQYGYYNLQDSVVEKATGDVEYQTASGQMEFYAENMKYDDESKTISFFLLDEKIATVKADKFSFKFLGHVD